MRRVMVRAPGAISSRFGHHVGLLLALAVVVAGFFLLLDLLTSLVSSGPDDILAVNPSEGAIGLPSGVKLLTFSVVAVSIILGTTALLATQRWPFTRNSIRPSLPLLGKGLIAVALVGAGLYVAFSGILSQDIPYGQYQVERSLLSPSALAILAIFFGFISIVGILTPRLILPILFVCLLLAMFIGLQQLSFSEAPSFEPALGGGSTSERSLPASASTTTESDESEWDLPQLSRGMGTAIALVIGALFLLSLTILGILRPRVALILGLFAALFIGLLYILPGGESGSLLGPASSVPSPGIASSSGPGSGGPSLALWILRGFFILFFLCAVVLGILMPRFMLRLLLLCVLVALALYITSACGGGYEGRESGEATSASLSGAEEIEKALMELESAGVQVERLEDGGALVSQGRGSSGSEGLEEALMALESAGAQVEWLESGGAMVSPITHPLEFGDIEESLMAFEDSGAEVERLENGSALVSQDTGSLDPEDLERALMALAAAGAQVERLANGSALVSPIAGSVEAEDLDRELTALATAGAKIERLANGSALISPITSSLLSGTTTKQATATSSGMHLFEVTGASHTRYLRTGVGDVYEEGRWEQLDPVTVPYAGTGTISESVGAQYSSGASDFAALPDWRRDTALLFERSSSTLAIDGGGVQTDTIQLRPTGRLTGLSRGPVPTSLTLVDSPLQGDFRPFSATFSASRSVTSYSWTSTIVSHSDARYSAAMPSSDPTYTQLPSDLPNRIRRMALEVTEGHTTPYEKAKALQHYLKTQYTYTFASSTGEGQPPPGHDPADWFLFEQREGTCGAFSTAFVIMARSIGIPARVVSGWVIRPQAGLQLVSSGQAHQWAEVPFADIGWVRFEPTAAGGAPSRLSVVEEPRIEVAVPSGPVPTPVQDTVTNITQWPPRIRRQIAFTVGGTVDTVAGEPVDGMTVEVFVSETKEHGGTKIGVSETRLGEFQAEVLIPAALDLGAYQLLARAVPNDDFNESWSDPDITVFSSGGLELTGPSQVPVDVEATFRGRVSEDTDAGASDREVQVTIDGTPTLSVITGPAGRFRFTKSFSDHGAHWVAVELKGQDLLLDNSVQLDFEVILPTETTISTPVLVEVGQEFRVTGDLMGARGEPIAGDYLNVQVGNGPAQSALTDDSGAFEFTSKVDDAGEFLVRAEFGGDSPVLPSEATARLVARHVIGLTLDAPTGLGESDDVTFRGRVTSETLSPIGLLELSIDDSAGNQLATVTTGEDGRFELSVPDSEALVAGPVTFQYGGDALIMPSSAFLTVPIAAAAAFNWLMWVGIPAVSVVVIVGGFAGRRVWAKPLLAVFRWRNVAQQRDSPEAGGPDGEEAATGPSLVQLEIQFLQQAQDLPDIWGLGEEVVIEVGVVDSEGHPMVGATVAVSLTAGSSEAQLTTDDAGKCTTTWMTQELGEYLVSAQLRTDEGGRDASTARSLRVVDFREEIVRLYNSFLDWAKERTTSISEQSTPREVELVLVEEGLPIDQRSLGQLISRFEEADYSEHPIARLHYETMYRAWHTIVGD